MSYDSGVRRVLVRSYIGRTVSKKRKSIEHQKLKEIRGSAHSYDNWNQLHAKVKDGDLTEHTQANPDELVDSTVSAPSTPQLIMGEAIDHLQGRQREVYLLTMREDKSLAEVAEILGIEKGSAQVYKSRAIKFIEKYCAEAIARGRV